MRVTVRPDWCLSLAVAAGWRAGRATCCESPTAMNPTPRAPQGATQRPAAISTGADSTGINPSEGPTQHNEPLTHEHAEDSST